MKSFNASLMTLFFFSLFLFSACSKDEESQNSAIDEGSQTIRLSDFSVSLNNIPSEWIITGDDVITIVNCDTRTINQFTDKVKFKEWSSLEGSLKSTNGKNLYESYQKLVKISKVAEELGIADNYNYGDEIPEEIMDMLSHESDSKEVEEKAALNWTILYDEVEYHGQLGLYSTTFTPALVNDHRNKTESFQLVGPDGTWYCDRTWFRGEKRFFITLTHYWLPDLEDFNNKTESIVSVI